MRCVDIICERYLAPDLKTLTIGGIQTYISDLCAVISDCGCSIRIIQYSHEDFHQKISESISVFGYKIIDESETKRRQILYEKALASQVNETLTIFATDIMIPKMVRSKAIAIQHGIFWDIPRQTTHTLVRQVLAKAYSAYKIVSGINRVDAVVCVDYNFLNWYRTQVDQTVNYATVIPNYTRIAPQYEKPENQVNLIFARRFFTYRGTRVFTEAVKKILEEGYHVNVTVAGSGPDEEWMKEQLGDFPQVTFITYESHESMQIHKDKHIAVVPTVGSEGTSLSLLEAMSAQCAVICTDVGGMTNIVLDGYNGKMVPAGNVTKLYEAMKDLIENPQEREKLAAEGYRTVKSAFSHEKWIERWTKIIEDLID